jgi:hypothetical protein
MPNYSADFWNAILSIITNEGGSLNNQNTVAQFAAVAAGDTAASAQAAAVLTKGGNFAISVDTDPILDMARSQSPNLAPPSPSRINCSIWA